MGLFSGKDITLVESVAVPLVDGDLPNTIRDAVLTAILNNRSISNYILAAQLNGFSVSIDKFFNYGINDFIDGLPEGTIQSNPIVDAAVKSIIEVEVGEPILLNSVGIDLPDYEIFAFEFMQDNHNWNSSTNILSLNQGNGTFQYTSHQAIPSPNFVIRIQLLEVFIGPLPSPGPPLVAFITLPIPRDEPYYHVTYELVSQPGITKYWTYQISSSVYPQLDIGEFGIISDFFPISVLRKDKVDINTDKSSERYKTTKELLSKLGIDIDAIIEGINDSPDITDLDDVFFIFALDIYTKREDSISYLYNFFEDLHLSDTITQAQYLASIPHLGFDPLSAAPSNSLTIKEGDFFTILEYNYITVTTQNGVLVNDFESEVVFIANTTYFNIHRERFEYKNSYIIFKKRLNANQYTQVLIHGLTHISKIATSPDKKSFKFVIRDLAATPTGSDAFFIPLSRRILEDFNGVDQELIVYDSMQLVFYAVVKVHLAFYETGFFRGFLGFIFTVISVISVILAILDFGVTASFTQALWDLVLQFGIVAVTPYVLDLLTEVFGDVVGVIATVAILQFGPKVIQGGLQSLAGLPFAETLLKSVTNIANTITKSIQADIQEINQQLEDLFFTQQEIEQELADARDLLNDTIYDPLSITTRFGLIGSDVSPDAFYQRTIHTGNPGIQALDAIGLYVTNALTLPSSDLNNNFI